MAYLFTLFFNIYFIIFTPLICDSLSFITAYTLFILSPLRLHAFFKYTVTHSELYFCLNLSLLCSCNHFLTRNFFKFWVGVARTNSVALPIRSTQSSMVEACLLSLRVMFIIPAPGTQQVYVAIKQFVACCSQTSFKCSVTGPAWTRKQALKRTVQFLLLMLSQKAFS